MDMKYFWFGYDEVLIKLPDDKKWQTLQFPDDEGDMIPWTPYRKLDTGAYWFQGFSQKLGLSEDLELQAICTDILDEMLDLAKADDCIFFMPPNQLSNIKPIVKAMKAPPKAVLPEATLLNSDNKSYIAQSPPQETDAYILNWKTPTTGILRTVEATNIKLRENIIAPVLMPATALTNQHPEIIGVYTEKKTLEFFGAKIHLPDVVSNRQKPAIGLVWVWGWGKNLWQWALPYTEIEVSSHEELQLVQENNEYKLRLHATDSEKTVAKFELLEPVIDWYRESTQKNSPVSTSLEDIEDD